MNIIQAIYAAKENKKPIRRLSWPPQVFIFINDKGNLSYNNKKFIDDTDLHLGKPEAYLATDWVIISSFAEAFKQRLN